MSSRGAPSATSCNMLCAVTCNPRGVDGLLTPVPNREHGDLPPASPSESHSSCPALPVRSRPSCHTYAHHLGCETLESPNYACPSASIQEMQPQTSSHLFTRALRGDQVLAHALHLASGAGTKAGLGQRLRRLRERSPTPRLRPAQAATANDVHACRPRGAVRGVRIVPRSTARSECGCR